MARGMLHQKIVDELIRRQEPMTIRELQDALGVPIPQLRTALVPEFYEQREIDHHQHGRMTAWVPHAGLVRIDRIDGKERYSVPMPVVHLAPEPEVIKAVIGDSYVDEKRPGLVLLVERVTATRIEGTLFNQLEHAKDPLHGKPYGADAETFRKVWTRPDRRVAA